MTGTVGTHGDAAGLAEDGVTLVRADNPSPMTLEGTNSYVLRSEDGASAALLDPGPELASHKEALLHAVGGAELRAIVLTHRHADHSEMLGSVAHWAPGVAVHAADPEYAAGATPLVDGQRIEFGTAAGDSLEIVTTPGHTDDSISVIHRSRLFSGDTILGRGTTMVSFPDGSLGDYLASLERLSARAAGGAIISIAPAHGEQREDVMELIAQYLAHRHERIEQVREVLAGRALSAEEVRDLIYADVPPAVKPAALQIVRAQLAYIESMDA